MIKTPRGISTTSSACRKRLHKNTFCAQDMQHGDFGDTSAIRRNDDEDDNDDSYHSLSHLKHGARSRSSSVADLASCGDYRIMDMIMREVSL